VDGTKAQPHPFDDAVTLERDNGQVRGRTTAPYNNMVGPFGGVTAAVIVRAIEQHPEVHGQPIALTVNYLGPIAEGGFELSARPVRTNRTNQHWTVELSQGGAVTTTATAVFGLRRPTWSATEAAPPTAPAPADVPVGGFPAAIAWAQNYEARFVDGGLDGLGGLPLDDSVTTMWIRDHPARALDFAALTAISDTFYPRVFRRLGSFVPAGTVSLTTYFHVSAEGLAKQGSEPLLATARAHRFGLGYFDQSAQLWGTGGTLLATSQQIVYFKA
jgi:hypothetical protein